MRFAARSPDLALFHSFLRFAYELASVVYPPAHPLRLLLLRLRVSGTAGIRQLARLLLDAYLEAIKTHVNPDDGFLVVQSVAFLGNFNWAGYVAPAIERGFRGLKRLEAQGKSSQSDVIHPIKLSLAEALHSSGRYAEAKSLVMEVLRGDGEPGCGHRKLSVYDFLLRDLLRERRYANAVALAEEALRFCADHLGPDHWRTARTKVTLSTCLERAGDTEAAAAVLADFDAQWELICQRPVTYSCSCGHRDEVEGEGQGQGQGQGQEGKSVGASTLLGLSERALELRLGPSPNLDPRLADVVKQDDGDDDIGLTPFIKSEEEDLQNISYDDGSTTETLTTC